MPRFQLLLGLPQAGKTERCLAAYAAALRAARSRQAAPQILWLTPAKESRQDVLSRLLSLTDGVVFQPNVLTFDRFAARVLNETQHTGQFITSSDRRLILRQLIADLRAEKEFKHFARLAGTEGFVDVVASFVAELKRAEIWPETFLAACRTQMKLQRQRNQELGLIYERYQSLLQEKNWYDSEGRFWLARTAMQNATDGFWKELSLVVVDGFSDFTRTQLEMLEQLAVGAETMLITLPLEEPLDRPELFAKPAGARAQLESMLEAHGGMAVFVAELAKSSDIGGKDTEVLATSATSKSQRSRSVKRSSPLPNPLPWGGGEGTKAEATRPTGLAQIRSELFRNPVKLERGSSPAGIRVLAALGERSEKFAVAWEIKQRLANGIASEQIVVALRTVATSGLAWQEYLAAAGIPVWCEAAPPWSRSPFLKMLFALLQMEQEDWPFERVQSVLNSGLFRPRAESWTWDAAASPQRVSRTLREMQLHSRRASMLRSVRRRAENPWKHDKEHTIADVRYADRVLQELADAGDSVRKPHTLAEWADVLAAWTRRLGLWSPGDDADAVDADQLQRVLRAAAGVEAALSETPPRHGLPELMIRLRDLVRSPSPQKMPSPRGRVRIVGAETLRHLRPEELFLVEMTEDAFPARRIEDCLLSEQERRQLSGGGLPVSHQELHQREEMLLFYLAATRGANSVTFSYSKVDAAGHENYPSPYLTALCDLFDPRIEPEVVGTLDPLPQKNTPLLTATDLRLKAVQLARDKAPGWWRLLLENKSTRPTARNVLAAAETAAKRFHTKGFTTYEGRLSNERNRKALEGRFSPQHEFSATELERYAYCPFAFWMSDVLELESLPAPEIATDHLRRGSLIHDVLAKLHDETGDPHSGVAERFRRLVAAGLDQRITEDELEQALLAVERRLLDKWAEEFEAQHAAYFEMLTEQQIAGVATRHEIPFGKARDNAPEDPQKRYPALQIGTGDDAVLLGGRIDRVDVIAEKSQFTLIDYKTGRRPAFSAKGLARGEALQLAIYTLAVMRLGIAGPEAYPLWFGYWTLKETGFAPAAGARGKAWTPLETTVLTELNRILNELVPKLVARIRAGEFVVASLEESCTSHCDFATVCRVNQLRSLPEVFEKRREELVTLPEKPK